MFYSATIEVIHSWPRPTSGLKPRLIVPSRFANDCREALTRAESDRPQAGPARLRFLKLAGVGLGGANENPMFLTFPTYATNEGTYALHATMAMPSGILVPEKDVVGRIDALIVPVGGGAVVGRTEDMVGRLEREACKSGGTAEQIISQLIKGLFAHDPANSPAVKELFNPDVVNSAFPEVALIKIPEGGLV